MKELALKFPCRVELFHSNICYGVEKSWPKRLFGRSNFQDLLPHQKRMLTRQMARDGVKLYNKYVDENQLKRRQKQQTNHTLAEYNEVRFLRNRYNRIRVLGDNVGWSDSDSDSDCSILTVIDNSNLYFANGIPSNACVSTNHLTSTVADLNDSEFGVHTARENSPMIHQHVESSVEIRESCSGKMGMSRASARSRKRQAPQPRISSKRAKHRSNLIQNHHVDHVNNGTVTLANRMNFAMANDCIEMLVEVPNQNMPHDDVGYEISIVEHIDITHDDSFHEGSGSDSGRLMIDERFDGTLTQNPKLALNAHTQTNGIIESITETTLSQLTQVVRCETVDIRYMHENLNENMELFLHQITSHIE